MGTGPREPFGGETYIADTSAWARSQDPVVRNEWFDAVESGQIATCPIVNLELLRSARDGDEFDALASELAQLRDVPITRSVTNVALDGFRRLAHEVAGRHRAVGLADLLIAAAAQDAGVGVLHYDADFDTLAAVLDFESRWITPRGSIP